MVSEERGAYGGGTWGGLPHTHLGRGLGIFELKMASCGAF